MGPRLRGDARVANVSGAIKRIGSDNPRGRGSRLRRGPLPAAFAEREDTGDRGAAADRGVEIDRAAVQLDERAHQREAKSRAAVMRAKRVGLEPIEYLVLYVRGDARPVVGD